MRGLRILITNHFLRARTGSELYVCELATSLLRLGHTPIVFSPQLGPTARELRSATVPVVDNLEAISTAPDLIHGQHHVETMTALTCQVLPSTTDALLMFCTSRSMNAAPRKKKCQCDSDHPFRPSDGSRRR